jgi:hypothetical protein
MDLTYNEMMKRLEDKLENALEGLEMAFENKDKKEIKRLQDDILKFRLMISKLNSIYMEVK